MTDRRCTEQEFLTLAYEGAQVEPMPPIRRGLTIVLEDAVIVFLEDVA